MRGVEPARVTAKVHGAGLLRSSIYQDGGWRVLADGRSVPTVRTDEPFVAAQIPRGVRSVELVYRPPGFIMGMTLAALALVTWTVAMTRFPSTGVPLSQWRAGGWERGQG